MTYSIVSFKTILKEFENNLYHLYLYFYYQAIHLHESLWIQQNVFVYVLSVSIFNFISNVSYFLLRCSSSLSPSSLSPFPLLLKFVMKTYWSSRRHPLTILAWAVTTMATNFPMDKLIRNPLNWLT